MFDSSLGARFPNPKIESRFGADTMPETADNLAREYQISREECDLFALGSQQKYAKAAKDGFFQSEIHPNSVPQGRNKPDLAVADDEHPRPETTMDTLLKLKPMFAQGVTTAGNASGINDGAAALIVASRDAGEKAGVKPMARIIASGVAGVEPRIMGFGPVPAAKKALERAGLTLKDMDVIEINEAFAAQVLACLKGFGVPLDDKRVNPNGGAIAVGPSARRLRRAPCSHGGAATAGDRRTLCARLHVHRRRPGHRGGAGTGVSCHPGLARSARSGTQGRIVERSILGSGSRILRFARNSGMTVSLCSRGATQPRSPPRCSRLRAARRPCRHPAAVAAGPALPRRLSTFTA